MPIHIADAPLPRVVEGRELRAEVLAQKFRLARKKRDDIGLMHTLSSING